MSKEFNTIGSFVRNEILTTELSNTEILDNVKKAFPSAKTTMACIAWYKSDMRRKGLIGGGRSQKRLESAQNELKQLKDKKWLESRIKELEATVKELKAVENKKETAK